MNLYAYVGNDPVNMVDPSGETIMQIVGGVIGAASTYRAGKKAGLKGGELLGATLVGGLIGAVTGGRGGTAIVQGFKATIGKAINSTTTQSVATVAGGTVSGAVGLSLIHI